MVKVILSELRPVIRTIFSPVVGAELIRERNTTMDGTQNQPTETPNEPTPVVATPEVKPTEEAAA